MSTLICNQYEYLKNNNFTVINTFIDNISDNIKTQFRKIRRTKSLNDIDFLCNISNIDILHKKIMKEKLINDNKLINEIINDVSIIILKNSKDLNFFLNDFKKKSLDIIKTMYKNNRDIKRHKICMNKVFDNQFYNFLTKISKSLQLVIINNINIIKKEKKYNLFFNEELKLEYKNINCSLKYFNTHPIEIIL
jgi:hypothetical protein